MTPLAIITIAIVGLICAVIYRMRANRQVKNEVAQVIRMKEIREVQELIGKMHQGVDAAVQEAKTKKEAYDAKYRNGANRPSTSNKPTDS
jgi:hypothetical protein